MFGSILQITIFSVIFIFLIHHLICFFTNTLTIPKIKDLVNAPSQKYKDIFEIISQNKNENGENDENNLDHSAFLPKLNMKDELKMFLKKQLNNESTNICDL